MNVYFHIASHHVREAITHAYLGIRAETEPVERRVREALGEEPEPTRREQIEAEVQAIEERARGRVEGAIGRVRRVA